MAYNDKNLKVDSSQRSLNEKVKSNIENTEEKIYWYIKFSQALDSESISKKTMCVTETNGYIFETKIIYNKALELIVIEPKGVYKEDEYYILHIKKEVRSEQMKNLKNDIHILFKVKGGEIAEFKELPENVIVAKPKKRRKTERKQSKSKVYLFEKENYEKFDLNSQVLPYISIKFNPIIGIIGILSFVASIFLNNIVITVAGALLSLFGVWHIINQMLKKDFRSNLSYNIGVSRFNRGAYKKANKSFKKALSINIKNEYAEFALNKCSFYL